MYNTTGFTRDEIIELCVIINAAELEPGTKLWPPILDCSDRLSPLLRICGVTASKRK